MSPPLLERAHLELGGGHQARLAVLGAQDAPHTALLLHGLPTSADLYGPLAQALAPHPVRLLIPDLPGYGGAPPLGSWHLDAHLDWLEALLDHLSLAPGELHLVGQDMGGLVAGELAARHGARSLSLTSCWLGLGWLPARITAWPLLERFFYGTFEGGLWLHHGVSPERRQALLDLYGQDQPPDLGQQMRQTARGLRPLLGRRRRIAAQGVPTLFLSGSEDRFVPPAAARIQARLLPGARLALVPGGRHFLPFDRPGATADTLWHFWQHAGPPAR